MNKHLEMGLFQLAGLIACLIFIAGIGLGENWWAFSLGYILVGALMNWLLLR